MYKKVIVYLLLIYFTILFGGCKSQSIQLDTNLAYFDKSVTTILFETKPGCSKTNFKFTDEYYKTHRNRNDCFVASDFNEYENIIKKFFEMDFFETIIPEYFDKNILIVIALTADDGEYFKKGKFEKGDRNNFIYKIESWYNAKILLFSKCSYEKIYIINMEKNIK